MAYERLSTSGNLFDLRHLMLLNIFVKVWEVITNYRTLRESVSSTILVLSYIRYFLRQRLLEKQLLPSLVRSLTVSLQYY